MITNLFSLNFLRLAITSLLLGITGLMVAVVPPVESGELTPEFKYSLELAPTFGIDTELLECQQNPSSLTAKIISPANGSRFNAGSTIQLSGAYDYKCADKGTVKPKYQWSLNNNDLEVDSLSSTVKNLAPGTYGIRFTVNLNGLKAQAETRFTINPVAVTPKPNTPPNVSIIRPKAGTYAANTSCSMAAFIPCYKVTAAGAGTDAQDGNLPGSSLKWYLISGKTKTYKGTGTTKNFDLINNTCSPVTYGIQLVGTDKNGASTSNQVNLTITNPYCIY